MRRLTASSLLVLLLAACGGDAPPTASQPPDDAQPAAASDARPGDFTAASRTFDDWRVLCDNLGGCTAYGASGVPGGWVVVRRAPGADAAPVVSAGVPERDGGENARLTLDGRAVRPGEDDLALARRLAQGATLAVGQGDRSVDISLDGAAAALLWMDERQGRIGTSGAVMRSGDGPDADVPGPGVPPRVPAAPAVSQAGLPTEGIELPAVLEAREDVQACRADSWPAAEPLHTVNRLAEGRYLWGVECYRGAYNLGRAYWITGENGADARPMLFPFAEGEPGNQLTGGVYDPETREMESASLGRGIGDCGTHARWRWTGEAFVLIHQATMEVCAGMSPDDWPVLYRAAGQ